LNRRLRRVGDRSLQTSLDCKALCAGSVSPYCHVTRCSGRRRLHEDSDKDHSLALSNWNERSLLSAPTCDSGIAELNTALNSLLPQLSSMCRPLVKKYRDVSCFDDRDTSSIDSFSLWNTYTDIVVKDRLVNGDSICYSTSPLTIEANSNTCVNNLQFKMEGPIKVVQNQIGAGPYALFGFDTDDNFIGSVLPVGKYTITTKLAGSNLPNTQVTFSITKC
jgi:hypothetical protein